MTQTLTDDRITTILTALDAGKRVYTDDELVIVAEMGYVRVGCLSVEITEDGLMYLMMN